MASAAETISLTVPGLSTATVARLRAVAATNGRSVEAEVRDLVEGAFGEKVAPERLPGEGAGEYLVRVTRPGVEMELPTRTASWHLRPVFGAD